MSARPLPETSAIETRPTPRETNSPYVESSLDESPDLLRERFAHWGYLFFRQVVSPKRCDTMLGALLEAAAPHLEPQPQGPPRLAGTPFSESDPTWDEVYPRIQSLEAFHRFFHEPPLSELMAVVTDAPVFVYPMKMARISTPGRVGFETPPHQDAHSHRAGPTMAGIWVALHDVASDMGRVKVLARSHLRGVRPVHQTQGVGGVACEIYPDETQWHVSDYRAGDVLIFHSRTVHKAEPNVSDGAVRVSVDTRFCDYGAPVFSTNLEPHHGWRIEGLDWPRVYTGWKDAALQYYWKDYPALF
jgi:hypothetical protein